MSARSRGGRGARAAAALAALSLLAPAGARADWTQAAPGDALALRLPADVAITAGGFAWWLGSELAKSKLAPAACRICNGADNRGLWGDPANGQDALNGADAFFHDQLTGALWSRKTSDTVSNALAVVLAPGGALAAAFLATGPHASDGAGARSALMVAESVAVAGTLIQSIKLVAARKRPFVRYGHASDGSTAGEGATYDAADLDSHLSFPSGHTGATAAATFSAAMVATLQDSPAAPWLWAGAGVLTASAAALRMMAEKHYFTDVLGGAVIGAASGVVMPLLHKRSGPLGTDAAPSVRMVPGAPGPMLAVGGRF